MSSYTLSHTISTHSWTLDSRMETMKLPIPMTTLRAWLTTPPPLLIQS